MSQPPRISAATIATAATRLLGTVILDLADATAAQPALYLARLEAFATIDGEELGPDDGTLINLLEPGQTARDLIEEHGTPGRAAEALRRRLAAEWRAA